MNPISPYGLDSAWMLPGLSTWSRKGGAMDFPGILASKIKADRTGMLEGVAKTLGVPEDRLRHAMDTAAQELGVRGQSLLDAFGTVSSGAAQADDALARARMALEGGRLAGASMALFSFRDSSYGSRSGSRYGGTGSSILDFFDSFPGLGYGRAPGSGLDFLSGSGSLGWGG